jgi:hypothetical protein
MDGFITYHQLRATRAEDSGTATGLDLDVEIADMAYICKGKSWATDDPLGIGGLLSDAFRVAQLIVAGDFEHADLLEVLLDASLQGLESYVKENPSAVPADYRLAFRELGLSIGLRAVKKLQELIRYNPGCFDKESPLRCLIEGLIRYDQVREDIEMFWLERTNRETNTWTEHRDINMVMLATSLAPDGYLTLGPSSNSVSR